MAETDHSNGIYSATYSNVPVYEFNTGGHHVMRRRHDDWINVTQILKVADYDKPSRTRILEKEVQKDQHEKVQGGYGKYQGTWVPLRAGRELAQRVNVLHKLLPLFDYVPGDVSPPPAPKHTTAASTKPRAPKTVGIKRASKPKPAHAISHMNAHPQDTYTMQLDNDESLENSSMASGSFMQEEELYQRLTNNGVSRKRKHTDEVNIDNNHQLYADSLLDYFIITGSDAPAPEDLVPPQMPEGFQIDRPIDNHNHVALHWAAAMGDLEMVKMFISYGANMQARNIRGETPIIRAVIFTNNYERDTMAKMVRLFQNTLQVRDDFGGTVFHHAAALTLSHVKKKGARYYLDILLNVLSEISSQQDFFRFLNAQDHNGDTALHIVARNNAKKCVRALQARGVASDIPNNQNETVDQILHQARRSHRFDFASSSPMQPESTMVNGHESLKTPRSAIIPSSSHLESQPARSFSDSFASMIPDKSLQVVLALETGLQVKETDLAEATRLLRNRVAERDQVRRETIALLDKSRDEYEDSDDDEKLAEEESRLMALNESLLEQLQHKSLHQEVRAEEQKLSPSAHHNHGTSNGDMTDEAEVEQKLRAALRLAELQAQRRIDAAAVVQAMATAGMSEKGEKYKKLISSTMGISTEEVSAMAPELLEVLEMSKADMTAARTHLDD